MTKEFAIGMIGIAYIAFMIVFLVSEDKTKKQIGKGMLILLGVAVVIPFAAGFLFLLTCFGLIGLG